MIERSIDKFRALSLGKMFTKQLGDLIKFMVVSAGKLKGPQRTHTIVFTYD